MKNYLIIFLILLVSCTKKRVFIDGRSISSNGFEFYEACTEKDNYLQDNIKKAKERPFTALEVKYICTHEALVMLKKSRRQPFFNFAYCKDRQGPNDKVWQLENITKIRPCVSKEYVNFVTKETEKLVSCFSNITFEELLPLITEESKFWYNIVRLGDKGKVHSSGLLQLGPPLTQYFLDNKGKKKVPYLDDTYFINTSTKSNFKFCSELKESIRKSPLKMASANNACNHTKAVDNFRKSLFYTLAQYSYAKSNHRENNSVKTAREFSRELISSEIIEARQDVRAKVWQDLARLNNNLGNGSLKRKLNSFIDLVKNKKLHIKITTPMTAEQFRFNFTKFLTDKRFFKVPVINGASYLYKIDCNQMNLENKVEEKFSLITEPVCGNEMSDLDQNRTQEIFGDYAEYTGYRNCVSNSVKKYLRENDYY